MIKNFLHSYKIQILSRCELLCSDGSPMLSCTAYVNFHFGPSRRPVFFCWHVFLLVCSFIGSTIGKRLKLSS